MDPSHGADQDALRIQVAAVAAQQAALIEAEARLQQRRMVMEQQEEQLSAYLEEKRSQLIELRNEVQAERAALRAERATYKRQVGQISRHFEKTRAEIASKHEQCQKKRNRLRRLRDRVKTRWHRHWTQQRDVLQQREHSLETRVLQVEKERERLKHEKEAFHQQRLRCNGENELDRRELQAGWMLLQEEQRQWADRKAQERSQLTGYVAQLEQRERALAGDRELWEAKRPVLKKEVEGLETRIQNQRRRMQEQESEILRLNTVIETLQTRASLPERPPVVELAPVASPSPDVAAVLLQEADDEFKRRIAELDALAGELADQRLHLTEQCQRLAQAQDRLQQDRETMAAELETLGRRLQTREQLIEITEERCRQREVDLLQQRHQLDRHQAEFTTRIAAWDGERERLMAELRAREELVEKSLATVANVRRQWQQRHQQGVTRLRTEYAACENLRQEYTVLRQEWQRQNALLGVKQRTLAQQILALEQYRQKYLKPASNPVAATKKLERLRRRCAALSATAERDLARSQQTLQAESARLEERFREFRDLVEEVHARDADLSTREVAWEHERLLADAAAAKLQQDVEALQAQRTVYEQQVGQLNDEIERLARLLMEEGDSGPLPFRQAA
jgi:chromosome segregation ATPase